jgi:integrase/recombinase XerD
MTILEAWELCEKDKKFLEYSPYTLKSYKVQANMLSRELNNCDIRYVTYQMLKEYLYKQDHLKHANLGHRVRFLHSFFRWGVDEGYINTNPAARVREPRLGRSVPKFLSEEDVELLRACCETPREHAIVEFMYSTGCRIGEVAQVDIEDIDWRTNSLVVHGKGNVEREVYFNVKCKIWLKKYIKSRSDDESPLFVTVRKYNGRPCRLSISQLRRVIKRVAQKAGVSTNVYPHRLRHSYATHLLNNGAPLEAIQQLLGHAKHESTEIYAHLSGERRRQLYRRYFNT